MAPKFDFTYIPADLTSSINSKNGKHKENHTKTHMIPENNDKDKT